MYTLSRQEVGNWILLDCLSQKQVIQNKIQIFEKKYKSDYKTFSKKIESTAIENFEAWDDSITWGAYDKFLSEILNKIEDIRHGNFQMA